MRERPGGDEEAGPGRRALKFSTHAAASLVGASVVAVLSVLWIHPKERAAIVTPDAAGMSGVSGSASAGVVRGAPTGRVAPGPPSMQHLDPARTNRSPFRAPRTPRARFSYDAGGPIAASPIAVGDGILVATLGGRVAIVDRAGNERARVELGERIYGSPLHVGNVVYLGIDKGALLALDDATLATRLRLPTEGDADTAPLLVAPDLIAFSAGSNLFGIDRKGTFRFRVKEQRKVFGAACLGPDGTIVWGAQGDAVIGYASDGAARFRAPMGGDVDAGCAVGDDGTIFAASDGKEVVALDAQGTRKWRREVPGFVRGALSVARDGAVLVSTYGPVPMVLALGAEDGREIFRFVIRGTGTEEFGIHGSPLEDRGGTLVFGAQDDFVYALEPTGALRWKYRLGGDVDQAVVLVDDDLLVVGASDGKLTALSD